MQKSKRIANRDKKAVLSNQFKETEENKRMGNTRVLFKKIRPLTESCCRLSRLTGLMSTPARDVLGFLRVSLVSSIVFSFPLLQMD